MSKYTTELRFICETNADLTESTGYSGVKDVLTKAAPKIFDFEFPIFDEQYRLPLEIKILRHYYTREISEETVGLWKLKLEDRLNVIMPYYNQLYKSELLTFNPMYDIDIVRDHNTKNNGETTSTNNRTINNESVDTIDNERNDVTHSVNNENSSTTNENTSNSVIDTTGNTSSTENGNVDKNSNAWRYYSDTPQGGVKGITNASYPENYPSIDRLAYLTNATNDTNTETTKTTGSSEGTTTGKQTSNDTVNGSVKVVGNSDGNITIDGKTHSVNTGHSYGTDNIDVKSNVTTTEDYLEHVRGKQGVNSYSKLLVEFRETFLNIDRMVIEELNDLFFGLW